MLSKETLKLIAVAVGAVALTSVICYVIFGMVLVPSTTTCELAEQHYICQKIALGIYQCVVR